MEFLVGRECSELEFWVFYCAFACGNEYLFICRERHEGVLKPLSGIMLMDRNVQRLQSTATSKTCWSISKNR